MGLKPTLPLGDKNVLFKSCGAVRDNSGGMTWVSRDALVEQVEVLAGFEADGFTGGDGDFGTGAGVAADAGFAGFDGEDAKAAQLDAVARGQRVLHRLKDGIDGGFRLDARQSGALYNTLNKVVLDQ